MEIVIVVVVILALLIAIGVGWYIGTLNTFRKMQVKIDESESSIDIALTKRYDLLTKMVAATKGYAKHEQETLAKVISMRQPNANSSMQEKQEFANELTKGIQAMNVVIERYPELKADKSFAKLQDATVEVEENLQATRRVYNSNVSHYNQKLVIFPSSIIAKMKKFVKRDFFEAEETKRKDVEFDF